MYFDGSVLTVRSDRYGVAEDKVALSGSVGFGANHSVGITSDSTKSGLITKFSGLTLGTVPSETLGSFYIRY